MAGCISLACLGDLEVNLSEENIRILEEKLYEVQKSFPGISNCAIIGPNGKALVDIPGPGKFSCLDILPQLSHLKRASQNFVETSGNGLHCPALHVKGRHCLISCYEVGSKLLVVVSESSAVMIELFDLQSADKAVAPQLAQIKGFFEQWK